VLVCVWVCSVGVSVGLRPRACMWVGEGVGGVGEGRGEGVREGVESLCL
jgi:hypothetical protein